ncbi:sensor histidine kinase [Corynebacterium epidermidicanis]|uniref:sensor histidine kinase n=1 Tax=Corynebacterium epidermidicanis TaxID=1050174 RepID=UPI0006413BE8|nr:histidine kinase [Corynebacterium epidermidicanis]
MKWFGRGRLQEGVSESEAVARIAQLTASRRAIADAYEVERQRIERDLHDGTQQYLVAALIKLGEIEATQDSSMPNGIRELLAGARADLSAGLASLRETVRGIHPQVLADRGLVAALNDVATSHGPHVTIYAPHPLPALSPSVLAAGYFFAVEALTNAAKHAPGAAVNVLLTADRNLRISVVDQGEGGAELRPGHGLSGMKERLEAFDGTLSLSSPRGGPTQIIGSIPLLLDRGQPSIPEES